MRIEHGLQFLQKRNKKILMIISFDLVNYPTRCSDTEARIDIKCY